jgi:HSP20 family molecular chaperone IbpA
MRGTRFEMMHDHVRAIHRAVTGADPPDAAPGEGAPAPAADEVSQRFAELEALARSIAPIAERVPPFSFSPPLDVIETARELIVELGVPGVERADVEAEVSGHTLVISGARSTTQPPEGRIYLHAELPRGPFRREVRLPEPAGGAPRLEVEHGIVRVRLARSAKTPLPRA